MDINLSSITKPISAFFKRFHVVIFAVTVFGGLAIAILTLSSTLQKASDTSDLGASAPGLNTQFDQETIDKINSLHAANDNAGNIDLPAGRINPLAE